MIKLITSVRLGSVVPNGLGGAQASAIGIIYSFLLQEFHQTAYKKIWINQIEDASNEKILKNSSTEIFINIRFSSSTDNPSLDRLNLIHESLLRIAAFEQRLDPESIQSIRKKILENKFTFKFICNEYKTKSGDKKAWLLVEPQEEVFRYFIRVQSKGLECELPIYLGRPEIFYASGLFGKGIWKDEDKLVLKGSEKDMEMKINYVAKTIEVVNLTKYNNPPYYQMMRADISQEQRQAASVDWKHSLPPHISAIVDQNNN